MPKTITVTEMDHHVASGNAAPLLPEGVPGPVHYASQWWAVPKTEQDYVPVSDRAVVAQYDDLAKRHAAGVAAVHAERKAARG